MGQVLAAVLAFPRDCDERECCGERERCGEGAAKGTVRSTESPSATLSNAPECWLVDDGGR